MTASSERAAEALTRAHTPAAPAGRIPDFFIVGHAKCGTTALYEMLRRHPQIFMPSMKEPQFFATGEPQPPRARSLAFRGKHAMTFEQYLSLFAPAAPDQRVGEASTFYLWSELAPARIAEVQPAARIIAIFREPASFVRSVHLQMLQNNAESETDLRKALALEDARREGRRIPRHSRWPEALMYSERVHYVEQLRRYRDVFPAEQMLVLIYDDLRADNEAAVRRVLRFLEVDDTVPVEPVRANPSVALRSKRANQLRRSLNSGDGRIVQAVKSAGKALSSQRVRRAVYYSNVRRAAFRDAPPADEALMRELRERFRPEVLALSEYLDRDLMAEWGYDAAR